MLRWTAELYYHVNQAVQTDVTSAAFDKAGGCDKAMLVAYDHLASATLVMHYACYYNFVRI